MNDGGSLGEGGQGAAPTPPKSDDALQVYKLFADLIRKEDDLTNYRMTWSASVNAGLAAILGVLGKLSEAPGELFLLCCIFAGVGLYITFSTMKSLDSANKQLSLIKRAYNGKWRAYFNDRSIPPPFLSAPVPGSLFGRWFRRRFVRWTRALPGFSDSTPGGRRRRGLIRWCARWFRGAERWWPHHIQIAIIALWIALVILAGAHWLLRPAPAAGPGRGVSSPAGATTP